MRVFTSTSTKCDTVSVTIDGDVWGVVWSIQGVHVVSMVACKELGCCHKLLYTIKWHCEKVQNQIRLAAISAENISITKKEKIEKLRDTAYWLVDMKKPIVKYMQHVTSKRHQKHAETWLYDDKLTKTGEHNIFVWAKRNVHMYRNVWLVKTSYVSFLVTQVRPNFQKDGDQTQKKFPRLHCDFYERN